MKFSLNYFEQGFCRRADIKCGDKMARIRVNGDVVAGQGSK